jgi:catechol 2,3-dioxygenase-like lactoylglutathione lyase family enzyme
MNPQITVLTLGVADLERSVKFYRDGLGFKTQGIIGTEFKHGAVAFFELQSGLKLALWPRSSIAFDTGLPEQLPSATELTIGHNVDSTLAVDAVMNQALKAGALIVKSAHSTFYGGYAGYFQDPDGHLGKWYITRLSTFELAYSMLCNHFSYTIKAVATCRPSPIRML